MFQPAPLTTRDDQQFDAGGVQVTRRRNGKRWLVVIVGLLVVFLGLALTKVSQFRTMIAVGKTMVPPPESVASAKVQSFDWQPTRNGVGTLVALRGVTLGAEVTGTVREIGFENGGLVKKGQLIVRLDTSAESAQLAERAAPTPPSPSRPWSAPCRCASRRSTPRPTWRTPRPRTSRPRRRW